MKYINYHSKNILTQANQRHWLEKKTMLEDLIVSCNHQCSLQINHSGSNVLIYNINKYPLIIIISRCILDEWLECAQYIL